LQLHATALAKLDKLVLFWAHFDYKFGNSKWQKLAKQLIRRQNGNREASARQPSRKAAAMPMDGVFRLQTGCMPSLPTPNTMSSNASTAAEIGGDPDYKSQVNGIIPGYSGHVPRARDKYAGSALGGIVPEGAAGRGAPGRGPQAGHVRPEDVLPPRFVDYVSNARGVMPGYCGFRPESGHVKNVSAYGAIPFGGVGGINDAIGLNAGLNMSSMGDGLHQGCRDFDYRRPQDVEEPPPSFRDNVGGVLPGYTGHVPRAVEKHGTSHYGGLSPDKMYVPLSQTGHEGYKISAPGQPCGQAGEKDVDVKVIPNYRARPMRTRRYERPALCLCVPARDRPTATHS
jgi:hypothetical protein